MKNIENITENTLGKRDCNTKSLWETASGNSTNKGFFSPDKVYDTLIIGGGITGLTTAFLLQTKGKNCVLADMAKIGFGTTGGTTAHLNTIFDTPYSEIDNDFGKEASKLVADSGKETISMIADLVEKYQIDCDFEGKEAYLYAETDEQIKELDDLIESSKQAGIAITEVESIDIPMTFKKAIRIAGQAQIHPIKYIEKLAEIFVAAGGVILENTKIDKTSYQDNVHTAEGGSLKIKAKNLVYATHIPPGINLLHFRCAPYRSYVLGIKLNDDDAYPDGLVYDMQEPYHYLRTHVIEGQKYLILGGADHKTGHNEPEKAFSELEAYARNYYNIADITYKWSSQFYEPADGLPYIGHLPGADEQTFVATGFSGNGITFGSLAAKIISDAILGIENRYAKLFNPSRIKPVAGFQEFIKENTDVAYHFIADRLAVEEINSLQEIEADKGKIIKYKDQKLAVYKSKTGEIHALNPVCTHAKCIVNWNDVEKSWDCPCHGGRFDINGCVLTGPPSKNLQKVIID